LDLNLSFEDKQPCPTETIIGISQSIFEGDSEIAINFLKQGDTLRSAYGHLIKDSLVHVNSLQSSFFSHIYRQSNIVAHALVRRATFSSPLLIWMKNVPFDCFSFVTIDLSVD